MINAQNHGLKFMFTERRFAVTLALIKKSLHDGFALDIGCGNNPYLFHKYIKNYIGLDVNIDILRKISRDIPDANLIRVSVIGHYTAFRAKRSSLFIYITY